MSVHCALLIRKISIVIVMNVYYKLLFSYSRPKFFWSRSVESWAARKWFLCTLSCLWASRALLIHRKSHRHPELRRTVNNTKKHYYLTHATDGQLINFHKIDSIVLSQFNVFYLIYLFIVIIQFFFFLTMPGKQRLYS